ncbi:MAG: carbamoyltransferase [bacterium]
MILVLGISSLDNDSTAVLYKDGQLMMAVMEERLTKKKHQNGFPVQAVARIFEDTGLSPDRIDAVAYPFFHWARERDLLWKAFNADIRHSLTCDEPFASKLWHEAEYLRWTAEASRNHKRFGIELEQNLQRMGLLSKLRRVGHQAAHAGAAFYPSGFERSLILTLDWYGEGLAGSVSLGDKHGIRRIHSIAYPHSLGLFYAQVTGALGFKMSHHEGKIVGLAAFGDPEKLSTRVHCRFEETDGDFRYKAGMNFQFGKELAKEYSREDISAAYQDVLEKVVSRLVEYYVKQEKVDSLVFAGGVAANVKLNQRLFEIPGIENIYIYPAMGDDGSGAGAALTLLAEKGIKPERLESVFLGPEFSDDEIKAALEKSGLTFKYYKSVEEKIAGYLSRDKVVARFNGRMEYGPRALGNRSILYSAKDPGVNDWLNKQLKRTEFMPFAPATLAEEADRCFLNIKGSEWATRFMTITVNCTGWMKENSPAAVHVDGTARPQLVSPDSSPSFHKILKAYRKKTGLPTLINTSFNMHENPIVSSPGDAIIAYKQSRIDILAIGNFIAFTPEP